MGDRIDSDLARFQQDVGDCTRLLQYALSGGWQPIAAGKDVDDATIQAIEDGADKSKAGQDVSATERAEFYRAYRDLSRLVAPVNAEHLMDDLAGKCQENDSHTA